MTREEAIEVLKDIYNYTRFDTYTTNEARTMAIKALEQEPCDDCVSRQSILDEFKDGTEGYDWVKWTRIDIIDAIEALPSVTPKREQGEWTRVEDGLPETHEDKHYCPKVSDNVVCKVKDGDDIIDMVCFLKEFYDGEKKWNTVYEVIAWIPIPKYEAESGENK